MDRDDLGQLIVMSAAEVDDIPWKDHGSGPGVRQKTLWQSGPVLLGLMQMDRGTENPIHVHEVAQHHILVTQGEATMLGKVVGAGSYLYIPPGTPHGVTDVGPEGVTFFYTYRPITTESGHHSHRGHHPAVSDAQAAVAF